jgi:hypothetical protein
MTSLLFTAAIALFSFAAFTVSAALYQAMPEIKAREPTRVHATPLHLWAMMLLLAGVCAALFGYWARLAGLQPAPSQLLMVKIALGLLLAVMWRHHLLRHALGQPARLAMLMSRAWQHICARLKQ